MSLRLRSLFVLFSVLLTLTGARSGLAQQTLGGLTGVVTDATGGILPGTDVTVVGDQTGLKRQQKTGSNGFYEFPNLPIGTYTLTFSHDGFQAQKFPGIDVQGNRTGSVNASLVVGNVTESVTVEATPLMNATDTTNGYVMDKQQIESIPLPTGSFTGVAILSPGVNAELAGGTGANSGLGNAPIWANGQRDTSNSFSLNGVDGSTLFNGKSTSGVGSARVINSTGVSSSTGAGGVIQSVASVYLSIGNAIPTPAPESLQEVRVNASMYDASQGSTSGAHIDISTASGTNDLHGSAYVRRGTNWINAAPFFFKNDGAIPENQKNPNLHRVVAGGTFGGPIIKNKLFGFISYQHLHVSDQEIGDSFLTVPVGLSDTNRTPAGLAALANNSFGSSLKASDIDKNVVPALFNSPALPGEPGKWLIPNDTGSAFLGPSHQFDAFIPGTGRFNADIGVANLDWNASSKDTLALKYYYQHDPTLAPYAYSSVPGFSEHLDSGSQVFSIINTYMVKSNLSTTQTIGFVREKTWATNEQAFGPGAIPGGTAGTGVINTFGSSYFPGISVYNVLGDYQSLNDIPNQSILNIGPNAEGQGSNTGAFQNRIQPSANANWILGKHTMSFGGSFSYTQLNTIDKRTNAGTIATDDFSQFVQGYVTPGGSYSGFYVSSFLRGNASRYYRANQVGTYWQDKFQVTPTVSLTGGLRYDWDGGFSEKEGRIFNFDPTVYQYTSATDTISNAGLIIAGNNKNGTPGVSNTTLTGRQWGIGPRLGIAWQPEMFHSKVVVRSGMGLYYDRGELFSYFSPGYAIGTVTGGPFGVNQQLPFVNVQSCPVQTQTLYNGYLPTCGGKGDGTAASAIAGNLENPYGSVALPGPNNPKASDLINYLPNIAGIKDFAQPISLGVYDRKNKLPYTINYTLDIQWQPRNDIAIELGYVGNLGRHQVIPVPFNQAQIATPTAPINNQVYSYGYSVVDNNYDPIALPASNGKPQGNFLETFEGGNLDLRVPYIGYAAESISYKAAGLSTYNALVAHFEKRMTHGLQFAVSYTYSHALDEQSGLGLFYNGNNPLNLRDAYASADFDRTHVIDINYVYRVPDLVKEHNIASYLANGWSITGLAVLQSGQPYSVIDFSGAVGGLYYSTNNGITNPIVPLAPGCTPKSAMTGKSGGFGIGDEALKSSCFTVPLLAPGAKGGAVPGNDPYETDFTSGQRNIFRQAFQKRADASLVKMTKLTERFNLKYTFDVFNVTNTTSFDVPGNEVSQNVDYVNTPVQGTPPTGGKDPLYGPALGLGIVSHTIGSPRQIQMSLALRF